ncbi:ubiquitin-like small modifier protein 1 [Halostagnicola bangensis]
MQVTCELYGPLREAVGGKSHEREVETDATVGDVFEALAAENPELEGFLFDDEEGFSDSVSVIRNGRNVAFEDGIETPVDEGDVLRASPPAEGG